MNNSFVLPVNMAVVISSLAFACMHAYGGVTKNGLTQLNSNAFAGVGKILFLGNSITKHSPLPALGWTNDCGMAASAESNDYVHIVQATVAEFTGSVPDIMIQRGADFERNYTNYNVEAEFAAAFAFAPDLFILAIGENVPALISEEQKEQFKDGVTRIINGVRAQSQPIIVIKSCFWANTAKDLALRQVAQQEGAIFVNIGALSSDESNYARSEREYSDPGVAAHPGDKGMSAIANAMLQAVLLQDNVVADNFEYVGEGYGTANGYVNMPIGEYKCQPYSGSSEFTNYQWFAEAGDLSKLVADTSAYAGSVRPLEGSTASLALNLETNGKTLVRTNNAALNFSYTPVYIDTLVKFVPCMINPSMGDSTVKAAVFVDANRHLWVYHGVGEDGKSPTTSDTGLVVDTNDWHRLTIMLSNFPGPSNHVFKIYIDQNLVSCAAGMDDARVSPGPWFWSASSEPTFTSMSFQGAGLIDELVVTGAEPDQGQSANLLTISFEPSQVVVSTNGISINNHDLVLNGAQIIINAEPWHEITSGGALFTGGDITNTVAGTAMITNIIGSVSGDAGSTNTIASAAYSQTTTIATGLGSDVPAYKVAAWAIANRLTTLDDDMLDDYLMNVDAGTNPTLYVDSIASDGTEATIVIKATGGVDLQAVNGILNVWTTDDLMTPFVSSGSTYVTAITGTHITVVVPGMAGSFIKATIDVIDQTP